MGHYIDIQIKPDAEMRENVLMNKVYSKFHKALSTLNSTDIAVSFPRHKVLLGNILRIHGSKIRMDELQNLNWLGGLIGYCQLTPIQNLPDRLLHRNISREQSNMTQSKLNRLLHRGSISAEEVKIYRAKMFSQSLDNAYLELESSSNGHKHRRYLNFGELQTKPTEGVFDRFGLSKQATIPWF